METIYKIFWTYVEDIYKCRRETSKLMQVILSNGLKVFLIEDHEVPIIKASVVMKGGQRASPGDKAGAPLCSLRPCHLLNKTGVQLPFKSPSCLCHRSPHFGPASFLKSMGSKYIRIWSNAQHQSNDMFPCQLCQANWYYQAVSISSYWCHADLSRRQWLYTQKKLINPWSRTEALQLEESSLSSALTLPVILHAHVYSWTVHGRFLAVKGKGLEPEERALAIGCWTPFEDTDS